MDDRQTSTQTVLDWAARRLAKLSSLHAKGIVTFKELAYEFATVAVWPDLFDAVVKALPSEVVDEITRIASTTTVYAHPEDICTPTITEYEPQPASESANIESNGRLTRYWCARNLREHFFPGTVLPAFEPFRLMGRVVEVRKPHMPGKSATSVLVVLELNSQRLFGWEYELARSYPVEFRADGAVVLRAVCGRDDYGRGLLVESSPHAKLVGTTAWIDRTELIGKPIAAYPLNFDEKWL